MRGQSIILVAVVIMALFVFVAITVDMSRAYYMRRQMQNAADAAALAGAGETCYSGRGKARQKAIQLAQLNEATGSVEVAMGGHRVTVTVIETFPTFFAGLVGIRTLEASATAGAWAKCGYDDDGKPKVMAVRLVE